MTPVMRSSTGAAILLVASVLTVSTAGAQSATPASTSCDANDPNSGAPVPPEQLAGKWKDMNRSGTVEIQPKDPTDKTNFVLHGAHDWQGTYKDGKLTFTRKPLADEMEQTAPAWARKAVEGKVEWSLEVEPKLKCGKQVMEGKWSPGLIKTDEEKDANGKVTSQQASVAGKGDPRDMRYERVRPAIFGVVVLDNQAGFAAQGVPYHPYPYPEPPARQTKAADQETEELNPFSFSVYSQAYEEFNPSGRSQYSGQANGRLVVLNERRTLFVFGQGLPRDWKSVGSATKAVTPGLGGAGLDYTVVALSGEKPEVMGDKYRAQFAQGRKEAEKDLADDPDALDMIQHADAMLVTVDLRSSVLPGWKDFTFHDSEGEIRGNTRWRLRFGDDRALISFGRESFFHESDLVDSVFLPERAFIEVKTEVALPIAKIPLRVKINDKDVTWNGAPTLDAELLPSDPTKRTYRTAVIELVEPGKPHGPSDRGVAFLTVNLHDKLVARLDDPGLLMGVSRPATVLRTPAELGMMWKDALLRAAKAKGVSVSDWASLPGKQAAEIANEKLFDVDFKNPGRASETLKIPVTVGDLAALLWFRDEFVRRMDTAINNKDNLPSITDPALLRGLRERLQPDAWDMKSAWNYLDVTCPNGGQCAFSYVLDDDFVKQSFKDDSQAADRWIVKAMAEAVQNYQKAGKDAMDAAKRIPDANVEGLIELLARDCTAEALDLPCGYKALRPLLLPRMMRLVDLDKPQRQLWISDLNARYTTRNLDTLISAVKAQQAFSSASTQTALMIGSLLAAPVLSEFGVVGETIANALNAPGANTAITMATEIPEGFRTKWEVQFAQGASLVLGQERLSEAIARRNEWVSGLVTSFGQSVVFDAIAAPRIGAEMRSAQILEEIEALRAQGYKGLDPKYQKAFLHVAADAKVLEATGNTKAMAEFDKRASAALDKVAEEMHVQPSPPQPAPPPAVEAQGDPLPVFDATPEPTPEPRTVDQAQQETPVPDDQATRRADEQATRPAEGGAPNAAAPPSASAPPIDIHNIPAGTQVGGFTIGPRLGEGADAIVYRLENPNIDGCQGGCVIKFYKSENAVNVVADIRTGETLLNGTNIEQIRAIRYSTEGMPYVIQPEIKGTRLDAVLKAGGALPDPTAMAPGSRILFGLEGEAATAADVARNEAQKAFFRANNKFHKAVLSLYRELVEKGLIWEDGHLNNIFFEKRGDDWVAGILDQDRLITFSDRSSPRMGKYIAEVEGTVMPRQLKSMTGQLRGVLGAAGAQEESWAQKMFNTSYDSLSDAQKAQIPKGPYFPNAEFFMEKALEYKLYLDFDIATKTFKDGLLTVDEAKEFFPKLGDPNIHAPIDQSMPHWWKTSSLLIPGGATVIRFAAARARPPLPGMNLQVAA